LQNNFYWGTNPGKFTFNRLETGLPSAAAGQITGDASASFLPGSVNYAEQTIRNFGVTGEV
jgi:hypothetical protein